MNKARSQYVASWLLKFQGRSIERCVALDKSPRMHQIFREKAEYIGLPRASINESFRCIHAFPYPYLLKTILHSKWLMHNAGKYGGNRSVCVYCIRVQYVCVGCSGNATFSWVVYSRTEHVDTLWTYQYNQRNLFSSFIYFLNLKITKLTDRFLFVRQSFLFFVVLSNAHAEFSTYSLARLNHFTSFCIVTAPPCRTAGSFTRHLNPSWLTHRD